MSSLYFERDKSILAAQRSVGVLSFKAQSGGFVVSTYRIRPHYFVDTNNEDLPRTRDPLTDPDARPWSRSVHARGFPYPSQRQDCMRHAHITLMRHGIRRSSAPNSDLSVNIRWLDGWRLRRPLVW